MINSNYGKTLENLTKRINVKLINKAEDYKKYISKPSFVSQKIFSENFVAILEIKAKSKYRKLSDEEIDVKREYGRNKYKNMSEEKKQRRIQREYKEVTVIKKIFISLKKKKLAVIKQKLREW